MHFPTPIVPVVAAVAVLGCWGLNEKLMRIPGPHGSLLLLRMGVLLTAAIGGAVVGLAVASWSFGAEVDTVRSASPAAIAWADRYEHLVAQRQGARQVLDAPPPPTVDRDAVLAGLEQQLREVIDALPDAEQAVVCERDGRCGSGVRGAGPIYREKVQHRTDLRVRRAELPGEIDGRRALVTRSVDDTNNAKAAAAGMLARVESDLDDLGPRPPPPGEVAAWFEVADRHWPTVVGVQATIIALFLLHLVVLFVVVRAVHGRYDRSAVTRSVVEGQADRDRGARPDHHGQQPLSETDADDVARTRSAREAERAIADLEERIEKQWWHSHAHRLVRDACADACTAAEFVRRVLERPGALTDVVRREVRRDDDYGKACTGLARATDDFAACLARIERLGSVRAHLDLLGIHAGALRTELGSAVLALRDVAQGVAESKEEEQHLRSAHAALRIAGEFQRRLGAVP